MGSIESLNGEIQTRSYWRWSKQDFFPEQSFQNWGTYISALSHTGLRFKDRFFGRSVDSDEVGKLQKESEHEMKRCLTWWDLLWFGFGSVIGSGIFAFTGQEAHNHAGPAIVLSYLASGFSAMLSVFWYYTRGVTHSRNLLKLIIFLVIIIASSIATAAYWALTPGGWVGYAVTVPLWFLATLGIAVFVPPERSPKVWGVPLVPWLPSLSIATNLFLMGSLGALAFVRFGICTVIMLIYYVFFGVHATYDLAHQDRAKTLGTVGIVEHDYMEIPHS